MFGRKKVTAAQMAEEKKQADIGKCKNAITDICGKIDRCKAEIVKAKVSDNEALRKFKSGKITKSQCLSMVAKATKLTSVWNDAKRKLEEDLDNVSNYMDNIKSDDSDIQSFVENAAEPIISSYGISIPGDSTNTTLFDRVTGSLNKNNTSEYTAEMYEDEIMDEARAKVDRVQAELDGGAKITTTEIRSVNNEIDNLLSGLDDIKIDEKN